MIPVKPMRMHVKMTSTSVLHCESPYDCLTKTVCYNNERDTYCVLNIERINQFTINIYTSDGQTLILLCACMMVSDNVYYCTPNVFIYGHDISFKSYSVF